MLVFLTVTLILLRCELAGQLVLLHLIGVIFVIINLVVDIIYAYLDPRIKYSKEEG